MTVTGHQHVPNVGTTGSPGTLQDRLDHRVYLAAQTARNDRLTGDGIQDVADSLNITNLSEAVAGALASDVEYRLHQIIEVSVYKSECYSSPTAPVGGSPVHAAFAANYDDHFGH